MDVLAASEAIDATPGRTGNGLATPFAALAAAVMHPLHVAIDGRTIEIGLLESIESSGAAVARVLSRITERTVAVDRVDSTHSSPIDHTRVALGVEFALGGDQGMIWIDFAAARAIVDSVAEGRTGLRGDGPLTETESGLLEYVVLRIVDSCHADREVVSTSFGLTGFLSRREISARDPGGTARIGFDVAVGGRDGRVDLYFDAPGGRSEELSVRAAARRAGGLREIDAFFELPPLAVAESEIEACRPGDLLALGMRDLGHPTRPATVTTSTMWRIATASLVDTTPTVLRARLGDLAVRPADRAPYARGNVLLRPRLGRVRLGLSELRQLAEHAVVDFAFERGSSATLLHGETEVGVAEIVRHDGELALRLLSFSPARISES